MPKKALGKGLGAIFGDESREIKKPEGDMVNITGKRWRHATAFFIPAPDFLQQFQKSIGKKH